MDELTIELWLADLAAAGVQLWFEGDRLRFRAPKGALVPEQRDRLAARKTEIVTHLRHVAARAHVDHPMSASQQSLWFIHMQAPHSVAYHVTFFARVRGPLDLAALQQATQAVVDRHPALRTVYPVLDGVPCQRVHGLVTCEVHAVALPAASEEQLRAAVQADSERTFDLEHGPLIRVSVHSTSAEDHVLSLVLHHIAADGWSLMLLVEELTKLYTEAVTSVPAQLPRPEVTYSDYVNWQRELLEGAEGQRQWAYWEKKLAAPRERLELPLDRPRTARNRRRGAAIQLVVPPETTRQLRAIATQEGTTFFVVALATFHAFLHRLTGTRDVIVGVPAFARSREEFMRVVGDFVNSLALRGAVDPQQSFQQLVNQLRTTVNEALAAQDAPFPMLVQRLAPERDFNRSPLFDVFFNLLRFDHFRELERLRSGDALSEPVTAGALTLLPYSLALDGNQFDLTMYLAERSDDLVCLLNYDPDLFDEATVQRFGEAYHALVTAVASDPSLRIEQLPGGARESATAILARLRRADIRLRLEGDALKVNAPKGAMNAEIKELIGAHRDELVAALRAERSELPGEPTYAVKKIARQGALPVSSAQRRLWFLDRMARGRRDYNIASTTRVRGPLRADVLQRAIDELTKRHESLRTILVEHDGAPEARIVPWSPTWARLEQWDLSDLGPEAAEASASERLAERLRAPFELATGPLARYVLVRLEPEHYVLGVFIHHIISDGWSILIMGRELLSLYESLRANALPALPELSLQYVDYAAWEHERLLSGRLGASLAYWKKQLAGAPALLELPTDRPRPAAPTFRGGRIHTTFDASLIEAVQQLGRKHEATLFMTLMSAFQVLLHRYSGQEDVVVGSPVANRDVPAFENILGCFVNNLAFRSQLGPETSFVALLKEFKQTTFSALEHRELPFDVLVDAVRQERSTHHAPIFQVLFALQTYITDVPAPQGLRIDPKPIYLDIDASRFDLAIEMAQVKGVYHVMYEYASDLFDRETVLRMHGHFELLLRGLVADPHAAIARVPMLPPDEQRYLLDTWNDTALEHDRARTLHQLLESSAARTPDRPAVTAGEATLTFRALDERANRLAHLLIARGVKPGSLVAVCVDRTADMPLALAAVLKTGAAYVPLDPTHPPDRLQYTLEDAQVSCVITLRRFAPLLVGEAPLLALDESEPELAALPTSAPAVAVRPEDRAYVIYTSGSTGRPKGVQVEHRNVVSFLEAMRRAPGFTADDRLLSVTTLSFDIAGLELWLPLFVGGHVTIASRTDVLDGERLIAMLQEHAITVLQATPATFRLMLDSGFRGRAGLKVLCGGEAMPRDLALALHERVGELWNVYGPTETTIWSTVCKIEDPSGPITVGGPIQNTRIYVLDSAGQPAPLGVPGELCIGGEGVARGYLNRPELNAEKFVSIRLPDGRSERIYRTGDMARVRGDGRLEFLGRRDHQVKVRGYRIELGEIETVLATHPGVKQCVVSVREDSPGDQRLVAYVVASDRESVLDTEAMRSTLRAKLPEYMIPNLFVDLAALPLTPNGKIDRKALPAPQASATPKPDNHADVLLTPIQQRVVNSWREVLKVERIGLYDNFFDVGGHSLLLTKLQASLKREFDRELTLVELFQWTTVAAQAERFTASAPSDEALRRAQARGARLNDA